MTNFPQVFWRENGTRTSPLVCVAFKANQQSPLFVCLFLLIAYQTLNSLGLAFGLSKKL